MIYTYKTYFILGMMLFPNGKKKEGEYKDGKLNGYGIKTTNYHLLFNSSI